MCDLEKCWRSTHAQSSVVSLERAACPPGSLGPLLTLSWQRLLVACRKGGTCGQEGRNEWKGPLPKETGLGCWRHVPGAAESPAASEGRTQDRIT